MTNTTDPVPDPDARLNAAATARCGAMGHHGRCVLTQGHDATIAHLYATPATPVPAEPGADLRQLLATERAAGRRDGLLEGAAALQDVIDRDRAFLNPRGQSRIALGGAREILLGLAGQDAVPTPLLSDRDRLFLSFALDLAGDRMASRSNEFDDEDRASLTALRKLAGGEV